jgi:hypothetical protein
MLAVFILLTVILSLSACGNDAAKEQENTITIQEWLDAKGGAETDMLTVTIIEIENPVWAVVEDSSNATVHLFGVMVDGEQKTFEEAGLDVGDTIVITAGKYNEYEGTVEIKEATLVEVK